MVFLRLFTISFIIAGMFLASPAFAFGSLIKSIDNPTVYYLDQENIRHIFPTASVYNTWYDNFDDVKELNKDEIIKYSLGKNITVRPGVTILTFENDKNIYGVEPGGIIRPFMNREVINDIYGDHWFEKVVSLPDVFFDNYFLGEKISNYHHLPNGTVYNYEGRYFLKRKEIAWPFKDLDSVLANGFSQDDIVYTKAHFNERKTEIDGFSETIFNPIDEVVEITADCENKNLRVAFLLVTNGKYTIDQLQKIEDIKKQLEEYLKQ